MFARNANSARKSHQAPKLRSVPYIVFLTATLVVFATDSLHLGIYF